MGLTNFAGSGDIGSYTDVSFRIPNYSNDLIQLNAELIVGIGSNLKFNRRFGMILGGGFHTEYQLENLVPDISDYTSNHIIDMGLGAGAHLYLKLSQNFMIKGGVTVNYDFYQINIDHNESTDTTQVDGFLITDPIEFMANIGIGFNF